MVEGEGNDPSLQESKSCVLTYCTTPLDKESALKALVTLTGFEPSIAAVKGQ